MTRLFRILVALALLGLFSPACDGGGDESPIDLGSDGKKASELSETEAIAACEDVVAYMEASNNDGQAQTHLICLTAGLIAKAFSNDDPAACQTSYDECMATPAEEGERTRNDSGCNNAYDGLKDCEATLGEVEACLADMDAANQAVYAQMEKLSCSSTEEEMNAVRENEPQEPESCKLVEEKCPGLMSGQRTSEVGSPTPATTPAPAPAPDEG